MIKILVVRNMHHTNLSRTEFVAVFQTNSDLQGRCRASLHRRRPVSKTAAWREWPSGSRTAFWNSVRTPNTVKNHLCRYQCKHVHVIILWYTRTKSHFKRSLVRNTHKNTVTRSTRRSVVCVRQSPLVRIVAAARDFVVCARTLR